MVVHDKNPQSGNMKIIKLTQGERTLIDDEDYDKVIKHSWCVHKNPKKHTIKKYAKARINKRNVYLHRFLLKPDSKILIDHINRDGLDNRRKNLRLVTASQNSMNSTGRVHTRKSKYKGVSWIRRDEKWAAKIEINNKKIILGVFNSQIQAARVYDKKAKELFGQYARLNFPKKVTF